MPHIMPEHEMDALRIEALLDRCFGKARHRKTVAKLRKGCLPAHGLAFVMLNDFGDIIGTIRLWDVKAGGVPMLLLGPVAIAPEYQKQGLGDALIRHSLAQAKALGHGAVILVGDAPYYERFGFKRALTLNLRLPGPVDLSRFLGLELYDNALSGTHGLVRAQGNKCGAKATARNKAA